MKDKLHFNDFTLEEARDRPARRSSLLWLYQSDIAAAIRAGYSYVQISDALMRAGVPVGPAWLSRWCRRRLGRIYRVPDAPRKPAASAGFEAAADSAAAQVGKSQPASPVPVRQSGAGKSSPSMGGASPPTPASTPSLADAYGPDTNDLSDLLTDLRRPQK